MELSNVRSQFLAVRRIVLPVAAPVFMGIVATVGSLLSADKFALHWGPAAILLGPAAISFAEKIAACRGE